MLQKHQKFCLIYSAQNKELNILLGTKQNSSKTVAFTVIFAVSDSSPAQLVELSLIER